MPKRMQNGDGAKCFVFFEVKYIILMQKRTKHRYFCTEPKKLDSIN